MGSIIAVYAVLVVLVVAAVLGLQRAAKARDEALRRVATDLGLDTVAEGSRRSGQRLTATGTVWTRPVEILTWHEPTSAGGRPSVQHRQRLEVRFPRGPAEFRATHRTRGRTLAARTRGRGVTTADSAFDEAVLVESRMPARTVDHLDEERRRSIASILHRRPEAEVSNGAIILDLVGVLPEAELRIAVDQLVNEANRLARLAGDAP